MAEWHRGSARPSIRAASALVMLLLRVDVAGAVTLPFRTNVQPCWLQAGRSFAVDPGSLPPRPIRVIESSSPGDPFETLQLVATRWQLDASHPGPNRCAPSHALQAAGIGAADLSGLARRGRQRAGTRPAGAGLHFADGRPRG